MTALVIALAIIAVITAAVVGWLWFGEDLKQARAARGQEQREAVEAAAQARQAAETDQNRRREQEDAGIRQDPVDFLQWSRATDQTAVDLVDAQRVAEGEREDARRRATTAVVPGWTARTRGIAVVGAMWVPITLVTTIMTFLAWLGLAAESSNRIVFALLFAPIVAAILITAGGLLEAFHRPAAEGEEVRDRKRRWGLNILLGFAVLLVAGIAVAVTDVVAQQTVRIFFDGQITATQARIDVLGTDRTANAVPLTVAEAKLTSLRERSPKVAESTAYLYVVVSIVEFVTALCARPAYVLLRDHHRAKVAKRELEAAETGVRAAQQASQSHARRQTPALAERVRGAGLTFAAWNAAVAAANTGHGADPRSTRPAPAPGPAAAPRPAPTPNPSPNGQSHPRNPSPADLVESDPPPAHRWRSIVV